ncbi:hypothetical protein UA08_02893 [Talaromyces atroroseus]|uniref:Uncharacterized protein n=1 Tax=Talaromyces atroroseus TaxID=1441469 RepID=A0A225AJQ9_TALAT|nr:hypothetical protein UA08_02893 [Talaromyces atroroseus]OKL61751.1 hypothetical protein UA08_02893 [Talaromyces atroroseus]
MGGVFGCTAEQLAAGMEHLRVFDFQGSASGTMRGMIVDHDTEQIASFGSLILASMGGKSLTRLEVDLSFALDDFAPLPPVSMGPLLVSRHCPDLRILCLTSFPIHLSELKTFFEGLNGPLDIGLDDVLLLSSTWAEVLDLTRYKANWESFVARSRGAECNDMSEEESLAIFGDHSYPSLGKEGKATLYIRGYIKDNPLRIREGTSAS